MLLNDVYSSFLYSWNSYSYYEVIIILKYQTGPTKFTPPNAVVSLEHSGQNESLITTDRVAAQIDFYKFHVNSDIPNRRFQKEC